METVVLLRGPLGRVLLDGVGCGPSTWKALEVCRRSCLTGIEVSPSLLSPAPSQWTVRVTETQSGEAGEPLLAHRVPLRILEKDALTDGICSRKNPCSGGTRCGQQTISSCTQRCSSKQAGLVRISTPPLPTLSPTPRAQRPVDDAQETLRP